MEIRYPGMAPTPAQLEKIMENAGREPDTRDLRDLDFNRRIDESLEGDDTPPKYEIRTEDFPDGVEMGIIPTLRNEVNQLIYSTHWEFQKRVLDHVDAMCATERQWTTMRRILMGIMTEQVEKTRMLVGQRIRQEIYRTNKPENEDE